MTPSDTGPRFELGARTLRFAVLGSLLQVAALIPIPFVVRQIFDDLSNDEPEGSELLRLGAMLIVLQLLSASATVILRSRVGSDAADKGHRLRSWAQDLLLTRSIRSLRSHDDAELLQAAVTLPGRIEDGHRVLIGLVLPSALTMVSILAVLFVLDWRMAAMLLLAFPVLVLTQRKARSAVRAHLAEGSRAEHHLTLVTLSLIERLETVRSPRSTSMERDRFGSASGALRSSSSRLALSRSIVMTSNATAVVMTVTGLLLLGGWRVEQGDLTIGEFLAFYAGVAILRGPAQSLGNSLPLLDNARDARRMIEELADQLDGAPRGGSEMVAVDRSIVLEHVAFAYGSEPVLIDVNLELRRGDVTALVGPNGVGKSTLVLLILGLLAPDGGRLSIDGISYDDMDLPDLRQRIGVSFQQPFLAPVSIIDNVTYGRTFEQSQIDAALELAGVDVLARRLELGVDTLVGPGGRRLSKGQEQRIALARAIIGDPPVLILDEPTNHLDPETVTRFMDRLVDLPHRPCILVVSHDHRALDRADAVVEMHDGRLHSARPRPR